MADSASFILSLARHQWPRLSVGLVFLVIGAVAQAVLLPQIFGALIDAVSSDGAGGTDRDRRAALGTAVGEVRLARTNDG